MFDIVKEVVKKQIQKTIDANKDGQITPDDVIIVGVVLVKKGLPYVDRWCDDYLAKHGIKKPETILIDLP